MENETKEKIKLTTREILLSLYDEVSKVEEIFVRPWQRKRIKEYWNWRELDKNRFHAALWRLEKQKYIKRYGKNKKTIIKLTSVGKNQAVKYIFKNHEIKQPKIWDKKWHIVIFDIPEKKKVVRNIIRSHLKNWGFYQLQESVFIYPFSCQKEISALKYIYRLGNYLQYVIAETIETEINLVDHFYELEILNKKYLS